MEEKSAEKSLRLQKYLAQCGVASRRAAEVLIAAGRVTVNGRPVIAMGALVDPAVDTVAVDGVAIRPERQHRYLLLYKPAGYLCTVRDDRGRRSVLELLPTIGERIYPVGRLDYDTAGVLLLTNDGALTQALLHPSRQVTKTYQAWVSGVPDAGALRRLREGVRLTDGLTAPAQARLLARRDERALLELTIHEGRNRQVKRMCQAVGHPVLSLRRTRFAGLDLRGLRVGEYRELSADEIAALKQAVGI